MFLYSSWRALDLPTRIKIATELGIKKVGPTHVRDNIIESDGYLIKEVETALSVENLQKHFDTTETNTETLWEWLVKGKPIPITATPVATTISSITSTSDKQNGTKRKRKNK